MLPSPKKSPWPRVPSWTPSLDTTAFPALMKYILSPFSPSLKMAWFLAKYTVLREDMRSEKEVRSTFLSRRFLLFDELTISEICLLSVEVSLMSVFSARTRAKSSAETEPLCSLSNISKAFSIMRELLESFVDCLTRTAKMPASTFSRISLNFSRRMLESAILYLAVAPCSQGWDSISEAVRRLAGSGVMSFFMRSVAAGERWPVRF
mmetsp:Transcript_20759/g.43286  ORF Transcript_20759/g.43286 Transcript_20759/m.43286 type:complete len:207 (+) Transcript_20759:785-1405(+)